jgi:hypothetical protein
MTTPGSGDGTPPPNWSSYLLTLPKEVRDVALYRFLSAAVKDRKDYGNLLLNIAKSLAGAQGGTQASNEVAASALARGADPREWTQYLLQLPVEQRNLILYQYLSAAVRNRITYALLLGKIAQQVIRDHPEMALELIGHVIEEYDHEHEHAS